MSSAPEALDPRFTTSAVATRLAALVAAPLFVIGDDLRPTPLLAASADHPDPLTWIVKLKPGARFHDGAPLTARDVVWTFSSMKDPAVGSPHAAKLQHVTGVVAEDELTVRFVLDAPYPPLLVDMNAYGILEERACARAPDACRDAPMGAGPYAVSRALDENETLVLAADPGWIEGAPAIGAVEVRVLRDNTTRLLELQDARIDLVVSDLLPTDIDVLQETPGIAVDRARGLGFSYLAFNVRPAAAGRPAPLADPGVRRALAEALDVDRVIRTKLRGRAVRATGLLPDGHWAKDPAAQPVPFDPEGARKALAGRHLHVTLATSTDWLRASIAQIFAAQWRDAGVDVDIEVRDWSALYQDIQKGAFDAFSAKWVPVLEPDLMHWVYASASIPRPGRAGGNRGGYADADVDGWLDAAETADDPAARAALYVQAQRRVARDLPVVPLWFEDEVAARSTRLHDFRLTRTVSLLPLAQARLE